MTTFANRLCHRCGADVTVGRRFEDSVGHSFCDRCWHARPLGAARPNPTPAAVATPAPKYFCGVCHQSVLPADVHFITGEITCPGCFHIKTSEVEHPTGVCQHCQATFAADRLSTFSGQRVCEECREELRIAANQQAQSRRAAIEASRPSYMVRSFRRYGGENPVASIVGGAIALAMIIGVTVVVTRGGLSLTARKTIAVHDEARQTIEYLSREDARQRLESDPAFYIERDGTRLTREDALRYLAR